MWQERSVWWDMVCVVGGGGLCGGRRWSVWWQEVVCVVAGGGLCGGRRWSVWQEVVCVVAGGSLCILCFLCEMPRNRKSRVGAKHSLLLPYKMTQI